MYFLRMTNELPCLHSQIGICTPGAGKFKHKCFLPSSKISLETSSRWITQGFHKLWQKWSLVSCFLKYANSNYTIAQQSGPQSTTYTCYVHRSPIWTTVHHIYLLCTSLTNLDHSPPHILAMYITHQSGPQSTTYTCYVHRSTEPYCRQF